MMYSVGGGIRYETPVGFLRFDLAYKLNPSSLDLRNPADVYRYQNGYTTTLPDHLPTRRFNIHISIGQAF
jgi:outer membrane protein insertion porin family